MNTSRARKLVIAALIVVVGAGESDGVTARGDRDAATTAPQPTIRIPPICRVIDCTPPRPPTPKPGPTPLPCRWSWCSPTPIPEPVPVPVPCRWSWCPPPNRPALIPVVVVAEPPPSLKQRVDAFVEERWAQHRESVQRGACRIVVGRVWSEFVREEWGLAGDDASVRDEYEELFIELLTDEFTLDGVPSRRIIDGLAAWLAGVAAGHTGTPEDLLHWHTRHTITREVCG